MNKKIALRLMLALLFIGGLTTFFVAGGVQWLQPQHLFARRDELMQLVEQQYLLAILGAAGIYILATALSIPGATVLSLMVGWLFGRWVGAVLVVLSATIGAWLVFLVARYVFADAARKRIEKSEQLNKMLNGFENSAFNYLLFLRLAPLFPFWLVNIAPAFTKIGSGTYLLATFIGILPGAFVYVNLGSSIGTIESLAGLVSIEVLVALGLLGVLSLIPILLPKKQEGPSLDPKPVPAPDFNPDSKPEKP